MHVFQLCKCTKIGEISEETVAMTLHVNADLIHVWQAVCHAPLIL